MSVWASPTPQAVNESHRLYIQAVNNIGSVTGTVLGTQEVNVRNNTQEWTVSDEDIFGGSVTATLTFNQDTGCEGMQVMVDYNDITEHVTNAGGTVTLRFEADLVGAGINCFIGETQVATGITGSIGILATFSGQRVQLMSGYWEEETWVGSADYGELSCPQSGNDTQDTNFDFEVATGTDVTVNFIPVTGCRLKSATLYTYDAIAGKVATDVTSDVVSNTYVIQNVTQQVELYAVFESDPEAYAVLSEDNTVLTFYYDKKKAERGGMDIGPFGSISQIPWYGVRESITTAVIDASMAEYDGLTSTGSWFYDCRALTTVTGLENLNMTNVTSTNGMFDHCTSLPSLDLSELNTASVTNMSVMFRSCSQLTTLDLSMLNTSNVENMSNMFAGCTSLTNLKLNGTFSTANVTTMEVMFNECSSLETLDLSTFNTANVTNMFMMFANCTALKTIYVGSGWTTDALTDGYNMFNGCDNLEGGAGTTLIALRDANTENYENYQFAHIDGGSSNPGYLTDINAPTSYNIRVSVVGNGTVTAGETTINSGTEQDVNVATGSSLILGFTPDSGYRLASVVVDTTDVTSQVIADTTGVSYYTLVGIYEEHTVTATFANDTPEAYAALNGDNTVLTFYYDKQKQERNGMGVGPFTTYTNRGWNDYATVITSIVFDESFTGATGLSSTAYWFYNFQNLSVITGLNNLNTSSVTNMRNMFSGCNALTSVDVSGFNTSNVTTMEGMFSGTTNLVVLDLSAFNTVNVSWMREMFRGSGLKTIYVGDTWSTENVSNGLYMFTECSGIVGGRGTTYNINHTDHAYAHIDGGTANPGYLTPKNGYGAAAVPTFTRVNNNKVLVSSETEGAIIRYTLDGTEPDSTSTVYSDSIGVDRNLTIKAYAARQNFTDSEVGTYTVDWFKVSDVEFVQTGNQVALSTATPDADIHYTLSTETGAPEHDYDGTPLTMSGDCIITAWATLEGYTPSEQTEFEFHADGVTCSNPVFARNGNVIKITTVTEQVQIFYTTNGTEPTEQSMLYADSILVDHNMVIKAIAMRQNYYPSQVISFTVDWFKADMPTFLWTNDQLSLSTATESGDIYYTIAADASSVSAPQQYSGAITVTQDAVITAWTQRQGWNNSDTLVIDYPYTAWVALLDAVNAAKDVIVLATGNDNVSQQMLNELQTLVAEAEAMYQARTAALTEVEDVTGSLNEQTAAVNQLATAVDEAYAVLTENNTVLTFYYDKKMQERNGMGVGPFSTEVERGWSTDPSAITTVVFDETFAGYTALSSTAYWFEHCSNLSTITGLPSLNTANVTDMSYMFDGCSVLASIDVSNFNTSKVTDMSRMFSSCYALQTLNLSSFNTLNVTSMKDLFAGCSSLASVNLSSFTTTNVSDMHSMFYGCTALQSLDLTSFNTAIVIDMENMFANSYSLNTIYVSGDWNTDAVSNGSSMFTDCIALVGGRGTVYDANHTDAAYARIDMAPDAPGYFTRKTQQMGDANDDGAVTVEDAVATVTNILGEPTVSYFSQTKADMNNDSLIDIFDVTLIVNAVFAAAPAPAHSMAGSIAAEDVRLTAQSNRMYMGIDKEGQFTAFQFDVTLPDGITLESLRLASGTTNHQLTYQKVSGSTYRVVGLSMTNELLTAANGRVVQLQLSENANEKDVKMNNVIFVGQPATDATAIRNHVSDGAAGRDAIYDLNGRYVGSDKSRLTKGIYIINHKKVNIK